MSVQKANPNSSNFDNLNPYHPNDPSSFHYPPVSDAQSTSDQRPVPTFNYTKVYSMASLPAASAASGFIAYVVDDPAGNRQQYSDGYNWKPLIQ